VTAAIGSPAIESPLRWLVPHPGQPAPTGYSVRAAAAWTGPGRLRLRYDVRGPAGTLRWPPATRLAERRDGLWQHTCCEAFIHTGGGSYLELNLAPEGHWAAYAFTAYRKRAARAPDLPAPQVLAESARDADGAHWTLQAEVALPLAIATHASLGLCAVLESARDATLSYWALAHPRAQPDFHDAAGHLPTKDLGTST
jgi:hypothetical protein